jgi:hypothetical protein
MSIGYIAPLAIGLCASCGGEGQVFSDIVCGGEHDTRVERCENCDGTGFGRVTPEIFAVLQSALTFERATTAHASITHPTGAEDNTLYWARAELIDAVRALKAKAEP